MIKPIISLFFTAALGFSLDSDAQHTHVMVMKNYSSEHEIIMDCDLEGEKYICQPSKFSKLPLKNPETQGKSIGYILTQIGIAICLTLFGGLMSGLTVGLASIDKLSLEIEAKGSADAKKQADIIFPVIAKHHWMLVTLLLCNAGAMEALPIFLDHLLPSWAAIVCSVTGVLAFGEIIPQALCTGPSQNKIAVMMCPVITALMWITSPISWPIAKLLDKLMGEHQETRFNNDQLRYLILLHSRAALSEMDKTHLPEDVEGLSHAQAKMIEGALLITDLKAEVIMKDFMNVAVLPMTSILDDKLLNKIKEIGYSRIPVCQSAEDKRVVGIFLTKSLVGYKICDETIREALIQKHIMIRPPLYFHREIQISEICRAFKEGQSHMGIVCETRETARALCEVADEFMEMIQKKKSEPLNKTEIFEDQVVGVLTFENVIERIMQMDIKDENDHERSRLPSAVYQSSHSNHNGDKTRSISIGGAALLRRGKSIAYQIDVEDTDKERSGSVNQVFTSKFMLNFAANLENIIRNDIIDETGKSDIVLRSLSRHYSQSSDGKPGYKPSIGDSMDLENEKNRKSANFGNF